MSKIQTTAKLTEEQEHALDACGGDLQGETFVVMRTDVVLSFFGYDSQDKLRRELQPAFDQADRGELHEWNVEQFLSRMHQQRAAQTD